VLAEHPGTFRCRQVKDGALADRGFAGHEVKPRQPVRVLQVQGIEHGVADVEQALAAGGRRDHHVARRVARGGGDADAGHHLAFSVEEGDPISDRIEVVVDSAGLPSWSSLYYMGGRRYHIMPRSTSADHFAHNVADDRLATVTTSVTATITSNTVDFSGCFGYTR
jgi:hypothetical protein